MGAAAVPCPEKVFCKILSKITMYIIENRGRNFGEIAVFLKICYDTLK